MVESKDILNQMKTILANFTAFSESVLDLEMGGVDWRTTVGGSELSAHRDIVQYK